MASHPNPIEVSGKHNAIYEAYYRQVDSKNLGTIEAVVAAKFLKKSGLSDVVLSRIWDLSDPNGNGYLDKQGFFVALKLIALAQYGNDIHIRNILTETPNPPKVGEIPKINQQQIKTSSGDWKILPNDIKAFDDLFNSHKPINGLLAGNEVRNILITSRLPMEVLSRIWDYADQDRDGNLDKIEFAIAMHLVKQVCERKRTLTMTLPTELEHKNVLRVYNESGIGNSYGGGGGGLIDTSLISPDNNNFVANFPSDIPPPPIVPPLPISMPSVRIPPIVPPPPLMPSLIGNDLLMSPPHQQHQQHQQPPISLSQSMQSDMDWVVSSTDAIRFNNIFRESDADLDGLVSGLEIKDIFLQSGVPQLCLAQIWNLCDTNQCGKLTSQQFALAMWLVERKQRGIDPPQMLAPNMIPPSLRKDMGMMGGGGGNNIGDISLMQSEIQQQQQQQPTYSNPELEMIAKEIDELARERRLLETDVAQKEADIRIKTGEIRSLQSELDTLAATLKQLENQKGEAQKRLDDLKNQKINIDESLNSLNNEIVVTRGKVNKIREQCQKQEETIKEQETELDSKRGELQKLKDEEQSLVRECDSNRTELDKLTVKLQDTQLQICQVKALVSQLIESQRQMNDALALCKEAIENNDPTLVYDYSLKLDPDFREAKGIILELETPKKDRFNEQKTINGTAIGIGTGGFDTDPFNDNRSNKNNTASGFDDDNFNTTNNNNNNNNHHHSGFDEPFSSTFSNNKIQQNDPFAAAGAASSTVSPIKHSIENTQKDEFGSDPFAILHAPTSSSQILSPSSMGFASQKLGGSGGGAPPPRPESPSPALPPKKSKQPPPRPAPPRPLQGPTPMKFENASSINDFGGGSTNQQSSSSGFADFADFDTKTSTSDFTEDPFKDYRYEDPFSIQDPFESVPKSITTDDDDDDDDDENDEDDADDVKGTKDKVDDPFGTKTNRIKTTTIMPYNNKIDDVFSDVKINSNQFFDNFSNLNDTKLLDIKMDKKFINDKLNKMDKNRNVIGNVKQNNDNDNEDDDDDDDEDEYESSPQSATDFDDDQFDKFNNNKQMKLKNNNNNNNNNNQNKFNAFNDVNDHQPDGFNGVIKNDDPFMKKINTTTTSDDAFFDAFNDNFNKNLNFNETNNHPNQLLNNIKNNNNNNNKKMDPFGGGIDDKISIKQNIITTSNATATATTTTAITDNFTADFNDNFEDEFSKIDFIDNNNLLVINNNIINNVIKNNNLILKNTKINQQLLPQNDDQNFATFADAFNDDDDNDAFGTVAAGGVDAKLKTINNNQQRISPSPAAPTNTKNRLSINKSPFDDDHDDDDDDDDNNLSDGFKNQIKNKNKKNDIKDKDLSIRSIPRYRTDRTNKNVRIEGKEITLGVINPLPPPPPSSSSSSSVIDKKNFTKDYSKTDTFEDDLQTILQRSLNEK